MVLDALLGLTVEIARQILFELCPLLPKGWQVYVQFDSWYASRQLIKFVRRQRWHVTCGLKSNDSLRNVPPR